MCRRFIRSNEHRRLQKDKSGCGGAVPPGLGSLPDDIQEGPAMREDDGLNRGTHLKRYRTEPEGTWGRYWGGQRDLRKVLVAQATEKKKLNKRERG